jgi:sugar lactone lactonase YvrE
MRFPFAALALAACGADPGPDNAPVDTIALTVAWTGEGLANPESVALSADGSFFYVSNVAGEGDARDGNGFIARVGRDGTVIDRQWARGLDAPKGVALAGGQLHVTDIDRIVTLDATAGTVLARHAVPGALFLNDIAVAPDGAVLASDSRAGNIVALRDGAVSVWLADSRLRSVNGLLPEPDRLIVTTMEGLLLAVDWRSKTITTLADGLGQADGVVRHRDGYIVGEWPGRLFRVAVDGTATVVLDTRAEPRLLNDFILVEDLLIVPNWEPGALTAWRVSER